ncbi:MAG: DUF2500 domain-containing protein [Oscillospiraceae bacterium]
MNLFSGVPVFFGFFSIVMLVFIVFAVVSAISKNRQNNAAPRLSVYATVAAKRTSTYMQQVGETTIPSETYYMLFRVDSGDTIEFVVDSSTYRGFTEGSRGALSFQGSRFLAFVPV